MLWLCLRGALLPSGAEGLLICLGCSGVPIGGEGMVTVERSLLRKQRRVSGEDSGRNGHVGPLKMVWRGAAACLLKTFLVIFVIALPSCWDLVHSLGAGVFSR